MTLLIIHGNLKRRSRRSGFHRTRRFLRDSEDKAETNSEIVSGGRGLRKGRFYTQ